MLMRIIASELKAEVERMHHMKGSFSLGISVSKPEYGLLLGGCAGYNSISFT